MYGNNFGSFKGVLYISEENKRLKISSSCFEISLLSSFNILVGILFGTEDLLSLSKDIMEITSSLSAGVIKK